MPIILPTEPQEAVVSNPKLLTLYGRQKVGKTTICSSLPDKYLILETDRYGEGADFIKCNRYPIKSYQDLIDVSIEIIKQGRPYKYLVLDTITTFEDYCERDATKRYKASQQGKKFDGYSVLEILSGEFSPGYQWLRQSFDVAMGKLVQAADHVIIIAHIRDKYVKVDDADKHYKDDNKVRAGELDLAGKIRSKLAQASDAVGFLYRTESAASGSKLWVSFQSDELANNSRCPHLVNKVMEFDWRKIYV